MGRIDINLALFGQRQAGKTVYLSMLVYSVQKRHSRRFFVRFNNSQSEKYVNDRISEIVEYEQWPSGTLIHGDEDVIFDIVAHDQNHFVRYRTTDLPGEIIRGLFIPGTDGVLWRDNLRRSLEPYKGYVEKICDIIDRSNSFMFLIDPKGDDDDQQRLYNDTGQDLMCAEIIDEIIKRKNVSSPEGMPPVAFVFTKWDAHADKFQDFDNYAKKVLCVTFDTHEEMLTNSAIMKCSGVGRTKMERVNDDDGNRNVLKPQRPIEPQGVAETLFWVIRSSNRVKLQEKNDDVGQQ